jgi:hypothetical protein
MAHGRRAVLASLVSVVAAGCTGDGEGGGTATPTAEPTRMA